eukprot:1326034-Rhodomonas_salina.3
MIRGRWSGFVNHSNPRRILTGALFRAQVPSVQSFLPSSAPAPSIAAHSTAARTSGAMLDPIGNAARPFRF